MSQYNYPGNETGGEGNPYGYPYGNSPYPPRKSFLQRIKDYFLCDKYIVLSATVTVIGLCVILYQFLAMAYSLVLRSVPALLDRYTNDYMFSTVIEMFYTVICVGGSFGAGYLFMKKMGLSEKSLPFSSPYSGSDSVLLVVAGLGLCFFGNIVTNFFVTAMSSLGFEFASYNYALTVPVNLPENAFEFICMAVHSAVLPAVFEEFAFRGVVMQPLRKYGDWFAIFFSAVLFGLIHGNMTQFPFAVIAGVALGYVAVVSGSLWTGVIVHFLNNFLSLMNNFARETLSDSAMMLFSFIAVYGTVFVGAAVLGMYVFRNPDFLRLRPGKYGKHRKKKLAAISVFMPTMAIAILWMLISLAKDIYF